MEKKVYVVLFDKTFPKGGAPLIDDKTMGGSLSNPPKKEELTHLGLDSVVFEEVVKFEDSTIYQVKPKE